MERRNYFEMLGLDFDPPEEKQGVIKQALDDWKKRKRICLPERQILRSAVRFPLNWICMTIFLKR